MCSSFVKCAPFQVAFALSIFPPFAIFVSFQLAFCFPIFSAIVMCASFRFAFSNSICLYFFGIVSPFFQDVNILEQAQFDSTIFDLSVCTSPYSIYNNVSKNIRGKRTGGLWQFSLSWRFAFGLGLWLMSRSAEVLSRRTDLNVEYVCCIRLYKGWMQSAEAIRTCGSTYLEKDLTQRMLLKCSNSWNCLNPLQVMG